MRRSLKIAISGLFIYLVFAIGNLLGPMKQFVPIIYFDTFFLPLCCLLFLFGKFSVLRYISLGLLFLSFLISGYVEWRGPLESHPELAILSMITLVLAVQIHTFSFFSTWKKYKSATKFLWVVFILTIQILSISLVLLLLNGSNLPNVSYIYWFGGIIGMILAEFSDRRDLPNEGDFRFVLVMSLSALFEMSNYFALLALS